MHKKQGKLKMLEIQKRMISIIEGMLDPNSKFKQIAEMSGISSHSWVAAAKGRQRATIEMIEFVAKEWPDYAYWLVTGDTEPEYGNYAPKNAKKMFTPRGTPKEWRTKERKHKQSMLKFLVANEETDFGALDQKILKDRETPENSTSHLWLERLLRAFDEPFDPRLVLMENKEELIELRKMSMQEAEETLKSIKVSRANFWSFRSDSGIAKSIGKFLHSITPKK